MDIRLVSISGGSAHNAIAREAEAIVACDPEQFSVFKKLSSFEQTIQSEYASTEKSPALTLSKTETDIIERSDVKESKPEFNILVSSPTAVDRKCLVSISPDYSFAPLRKLIRFLVNRTTEKEEKS